MASSPAEPAPGAAAGGDVAFLLQEAIACWDQGYEALARGDLERLDALLAIAGEYAARVAAPSADDDRTAKLRTDAVSSRGRLEHAMRAGLAGLADELARVRQGAKVLRGYTNQEGRLGGSFESRL